MERAADSFADALLSQATLAGVRGDDAQMEKAKVVRSVKAGSAVKFTEAEIEMYLERMQSENMAMLGGDKVYFV